MFIEIILKFFVNYIMNDQNVSCFFINNYICSFVGIEGFRHHLSVKLTGTKMVPMTLQITPHLNPRKALAILDGTKVKIIKAVMMGNRLDNNFDCEL